MAAEIRQQPEFSRQVILETIGEDETTTRIEPTVAERSALAVRFGLLAINRLVATVRLVRAEGGALVRVAGHFEAEVTQACVVSLEPVASRLEGDFSLFYDTTGGDEQQGGEIMVDLDRDDPPEPVPPGGIDLGEVVAEQVALALDAYPRAKGAALERDRWGGAAPDARDDSNPFAVLDSLRKP